MEIARGEFNYKDKTNKRRLTELTKKLKEAFGTKDSPFKKGVPRFKISNPSEIRAGESAQRKTVQYHENKHSNKQKEAADWLEDYPEFQDTIDD